MPMKIYIQALGELYKVVLCELQLSKDRPDCASHHCKQQAAKGCLYDSQVCKR